VVVDIRDVITCFKFGDDRFRGLASSDGHILPSLVDFDGRPYNTLTLPCERVIIQKRRLTLFGHLVRIDESADARRILTAVPQSEWRRPVGRPYTSWMAILKNDLAQHYLTLENAIELALNKPLWRLLAASGATH